MNYVIRHRDKQGSLWYAAGVTGDVIRHWCSNIRDARVYNDFELAERIKSAHNSKRDRYEASTHIVSVEENEDLD